MRLPPTGAPLAPGVDLHLHSDISDGVMSDVALVDLVQRSGVGVAAITDHDSIAAAHDPALRAHLEALGPKAPQVVPGVEVSVWLESPVRPGCWQECHILGLGCRPNEPNLRRALIRQRLNRYARVRATVERLRADGFPITFADVGFAAGLQTPTAWQVGHALALKGFAKDPDDAVKRLVAPRFPEPHALPGYPVLGPAEAIALIQAAGGAAILAHPHRNVPAHDDAAIRDLLSGLKAKGLDGVEVFRVDLPAVDRPLYVQAADAAGLLQSGGTDFHGAGDTGGPRTPGDAHAPPRIWPPIEALIRSRGGITDIRDHRVTLAPRASAAERMLFLERRG